VLTAVRHLVVEDNLSTFTDGQSDRQVKLKAQTYWAKPLLVFRVLGRATALSET